MVDRRPGRGGMSAPDYFELGRQMAAESRAAQGLPPTIESPAALARVAALLAPEHLNTGRVQPRRPLARGGVDQDAGDQGPGELAAPSEPAGSDRLGDGLTGPEAVDRLAAATSCDLAVDGSDAVVDRGGRLNELAA